MDEILKKSGIILQGFDIGALLGIIERATRKQQASSLSSIELFIDRETPEFTAIRKIVLDATNDLSRTIIKTIFGDVEF